MTLDDLARDSEPLFDKASELAECAVDAGNWSYAEDFRHLRGRLAAAQRAYPAAWRALFVALAADDEES